MLPEFFPIIEFDPSREAIIEPSQNIDPIDAPECCVICFFQDVLEQVISENNAKVIVDINWEDGHHRLYEIEHNVKRLAFFHPGVGSPIAAGILEEMIAYGCKKFIACGGAGVLDKDLAVGHLMVVNKAVRDEGTSYHYLPPSREVNANTIVVSLINSVLTERGLPFITGKTWTTDAPYRETRSRMLKRREEGCLMVEMESSALIAVSEFRGVPFGQILYGGDDLSGDEWDHRGWTSRQDIRRQLFWLCADIAQRL